MPITMADSHFIPRLMKPPQESYFLLGPRGTGKSTWLLHQYPQTVRIDLLLGEEERRFLAHPERIHAIAASIQSGGALIIDEIQRVPHLLPQIHALIEEKKGIQYIMTGSGARKLRRSVSDLLGGRAHLMQMGPFLASELKGQFSLEKALRIGMIPLIWQSTDPEASIRNYIQLYLREEVQAEGIIRNVNDFARFLEVASFSYGRILGHRSQTLFRFIP